jgi:hypothetical protein
VHKLVHIIVWRADGLKTGQPSLFAIKIAYSTIECMDCSDGWHAITDTEEDKSLVL